MTSRQIALEYVARCGRGDFDAVAQLLAPGVKYLGPGNATEGAPAYVAVLKRIAPVWRGSEVKKVFTDGDDVCVIYDFVTDTPAGVVPIVEWLHVADGRIDAIHLYFDRVAFKPAADELQLRAAQARGAAASR